MNYTIFIIVNDFKVLFINLKFIKLNHLKTIITKIENPDHFKFIYIHFALHNKTKYFSVHSYMKHFYFLYKAYTLIIKYLRCISDVTPAHN